MAVTVGKSLIKKHYTGDEFESKYVLNDGVTPENLYTDINSKHIRRGLKPTCVKSKRRRKRKK